MPRLEYFLVADSISTDKDRNTVSVFHIVEEWRAPLPLVIPSLVAVTSWRMESEEMGRDFQVTLDIRLPGGQKLPDVEVLPVNFTADHKRHRTYHFVQGLRIEQTGEAEFRILINGRYSASHFVWIQAADETR